MFTFKSEIEIRVLTISLPVIRTSGVSGTNFCRAISPDLRSFQISRSYNRKENQILKKIGWFLGALSLNRCLADGRRRCETFEFFFQKEESPGTERVNTLLSNPLLKINNFRVKLRHKTQQFYPKLKYLQISFSFTTFQGIFSFALDP